MDTRQMNPCATMLVIGIDLSTTRTFSGMSYALLEPGKEPQIQLVMRFLGQREEFQKQEKKLVPSAVCYNQDGYVIAVGAETVNPRLSMIEGVRFKLHLRSPHLVAISLKKLEPLHFLSPELPAEACDEYEYDLDDADTKGQLKLPNKKKIPHPVTFKTAVQVYADFLKYLFKSAKEYIVETTRILDPTFSWSSIEGNIYFVLTHPNEWKGNQQSLMRDAAVAADLVNVSTVADRITFVREVEAGFYFCLDKFPELLCESGGISVVYCGYETIDLIAYSLTEKGCFEETVPLNCLLQTSPFVTSRARDYFKERFKDSQYGSDDDIEAMVRAFDNPEGIKWMFHDPNKPYFVKFGGLRDNDWKYGISGGKFKVEGAQVAQFFEPVVQDIIGAIMDQCRNAKDEVPIKYVLLVGPFGRQHYLYARLRHHFNISGIVLVRPDINYFMMEANGAVSWYLNCFRTSGKWHSPL